MTKNICATESCNSEASLQCPTCIKQGLESGSSFFCSQDCFKQSWSSHKLIHKKKETSVQLTNPWPNFHFTGSLRPVYPLSKKREVPIRIPRPDYAEKGQPLSELALRGNNGIKILSEDEIEGVRTASKLAREVLEEVSSAVAPGVLTDELDRIVHEACVERDCYPSPLNYYGFPKSCCTSVNEVICHGIPDMRPLKDGDICNIDVTVYHNGFHGDLNETFLVGKNVPENAKRLVKTTWECLQKAIEMIQPGTKYRDIGNVIQRHAQSHGYSVVRSYCGHGIHRLFHTSPSIPHYAKNKAVGVMKAGHCFTIEPMINEGGWRDEQWPDDWTSVTMDGKLSAQFEETFLVTDTGVDILTKRTKSDLPYFMEQK